MSENRIEYGKSGKKNKRKEGGGRKPVESISSKVKKYTHDGKVKYMYTYGFYVHQDVIVKNLWNIDIIDVAIFYEIQTFINFIKYHPKEDQYIVEDELGKWFFVSEYKILKSMPLLPLSSGSSVYKRILKLIECDLIERNPNNTSTRMKLIRLGKNAHLLAAPKGEYKRED